MKRVCLLLFALFVSIPLRSEITGIVTFPEGTSGEVQFEQDGAFAGDSSFTYSTTTQRVTVSSASITYLDLSTATVRQIRWADGTIQVSSPSNSGSSSGGGLDSSTSVVINADNDGNGTGGIEFRINGTTKTIITNGGLVGISSSTPSYPLTINGQIYTSSGIVSDGSGIFRGGTGDYGIISTTSPALKFEIFGSTWTFYASSITNTQSIISILENLVFTSATINGISMTFPSSECSDGEIWEWDATNNRWICGADNTGGGGGTTVWIQEDGSAVDNAVSTISFNTGFNVTSSPAGKVSVNLDVASMTATYVNVAGDTMTGQLTVQSSVTLTNSDFSIAGSTVYVTQGRVGVGSIPSIAARLYTQENDPPSVGVGYASQSKYVYAPTAATDITAAVQAIGINTGSVDSTSGHMIGALMRASDTVSGRTDLFGSEGRVDAFSYQGSTMTGHLGYVLGTYAGTTDNIYHGLEARVQVTSDGSTPNPSGIARGVYIPDIVGGYSTATWATYQAGSDDPNYFAGNVGIGTQTPAGTLDVYGSAPTIYARGSSGVVGAVSAQSAAGGYVFLASTSPNPLVLGANNTEKIRIQSAGFVGVSTTSPVAQLAVGGGIVASSSVTAQAGVYTTTATLQFGTTSWQIFVSTEGQLTFKNPNIGDGNSFKRGSYFDLNTGYFGIGSDGRGMPDAPLSIYSDKAGTRPGIVVSHKNTGLTRESGLYFQNWDTPSQDVGTSIAFYGQTPDPEFADIQHGLLAFSQESTTNTAKFELFLRAGTDGAGNSDSLPVQRTVGTTTKGYAFTMFGPNGAEYAASYPYGAYPPAAMVHVASDFQDDSDGVMIERRRTPNANRYVMRVDENGDFLLRNRDYGSDAVTISSDTSYVGILKDPSYPLDVNGTVNVTAIRYPDGTVQVSSPTSTGGSGVAAGDNVNWTGIHTWQSSATFVNHAFSVGGSTLSISQGQVTISSLTLTNKLSVTQGGTGASDAATARTNLGLAIGSDVQGFDATLSDLASAPLTEDNSIDVSAVAAGTLPSDVIASSATTSLFYNNATIRSNLGLAIGSDVQGFDATLSDLASAPLGEADSVSVDAIAAGTLPSDVIASSVATNTIFQAQMADDAIGTNEMADADHGDVAWSGGAATVQNVAAANVAAGSLGGSVIASSATTSLFYNNATIRSNLGLAIGSDVQAYDATLDDLAAAPLGEDNSVSVGAIAAGTLPTDVLASSIALSGFYSADAVRTNLGLAIGSNVQAYDADLDDLADGSLSGSKVGSGVPAANIASGSLGAQVIASSITLAAMYGAPTLTGTNFTNIPGAQVTDGVPAANIAAGSLDTDVIASSVAVNAVTGKQISLTSEATGDVMYFDGTDWVKLGIGSPGQVLEVNSGGTAPEWDTDDSSVGGGDNLGNHVATTTLNMATFGITDAGKVDMSGTLTVGSSATFTNGNFSVAGSTLNIQQGRIGVNSIPSSAARIYATETAAPASGIGYTIQGRYDYTPTQVTDIVAAHQGLSINNSAISGTSGHFMGGLFRSSDTASGDVDLFGVEGRVDGFSINGSTHSGALGMVQMENTGSLAGFYNGVLARVKLTTDGTTANTNGTGRGVYIENVVGGSTNKNYGLFQEGIDDLNYFGGKVGIGTVTPLYALHQEGNGPVHMIRDNVGGVVYQASAQNAAGGYAFFGTTSTHPLLIASNNTERVRINASDGRVGISTTSPVAQLAVNGGIVASSTITAQGGFFQDGVLMGVSTKSFTTTISSGNVSWDNLAIPIFQAPQQKAITIRSVYATCMNGTSLTYNIEERAFASLASAGTDIYSSDQAADTNGEIETAFSNSGIAAGAHLVFTTGSTAASGTVDYITIQVNYTIDP